VPKWHLHVDTSSVGVSVARSRRPIGHKRRHSAKTNVSLGSISRCLLTQYVPIGSSTGACSSCDMLDQQVALCELLVHSCLPEFGELAAL
jgi:hypothetical protein